MSDHGWSVNLVVIGPKANKMAYRACCECGETFELQGTRDEAGLDGLDHVRTVAGRPTRRYEIEQERLAAIVERNAKRYGVQTGAL